MKVQYAPGSEEEQEYLKRLKRDLEEDALQGELEPSVSPSMSVIDSLGSDQAQEDFVAGFERLPVTARERVLDEMDRAAKLLDQNAMQKDYQAISLQIRLWEQRAKIEGMYKVAETRDIEKEVENRMESFKQTAIHFLFHVGMDSEKVRKWATLMGMEGF